MNLAPTAVPTSASIIAPGVIPTDKNYKNASHVTNSTPFLEAIERNKMSDPCVILNEINRKAYLKMIKLFKNEFRVFKFLI